MIDGPIRPCLKKYTNIMRILKLSFLSKFSLVVKNNGKVCPLVKQRTMALRGKVNHESAVEVTKANLTQNKISRNRSRNVRTYSDVQICVGNGTHT